MVIAIFGEQSAMMAALESRAAVRRGTISGTAITPAARQPKNATMKSSPGGNRSTARSPLTVRCARRAATARARLCSSANVRWMCAPPRSGTNTKAFASGLSAARRTSRSTSDAGAERESSSLKRCYRRVGAARDFVSSRPATKRVNCAMVGYSMAVSDASSSPNQSSMAATKNTDSAESSPRLVNSACTSIGASGSFSAVRR